MEEDCEWSTEKEVVMTHFTILCRDWQTSFRITTPWARTSLPLSSACVFISWARYHLAIGASVMKKIQSMHMTLGVLTVLNIRSVALYALWYQCTNVLEKPETCCTHLYSCSVILFDSLLTLKFLRKFQEVAVVHARTQIYYISDVLHAWGTV
jgi:hypothetical protein